MAEKNEWLIGRAVDASQGNFRIDNSEKSVSKVHAKLIRAEDGFYIEDLDSTQGTTVNGKRILKKKITADDKVMLGSYQLNIQEIIAGLPMSDNEFSQAFAQLKDVYDVYKSTRLKTQSQNQGSMMLKRSLPMALPGLLMVFISMLFMGGNPQTEEEKAKADMIRTVTMIAGGVLSAAAMVGGSIWGAKEMEKMQPRLDKLDEAFKNTYICPSCHKHFGQTTWENRDTFKTLCLIE
jgi:pSer/pThr/pTyr-binding forkhead associated (FHA) protein